MIDNRSSPRPGPVDCDETSAFTSLLGKNLPDRYIYEGDVDGGLLDYLKELNIHDLRDIVGQAADSDDTSQFIKAKRSPPPPYHLESSRGDMKERVSAYDLQTHFGGRKLKDFSLLSKLGKGISVIDSNNEVPTVGELVNQKRGR